MYLYAKPLVEALWIQSPLPEDLVSGHIRFRLKLSKKAKVHVKISHKADGILYEGDLELTPEIVSETSISKMGEMKFWTVS